MERGLEPKWGNDDWFAPIVLVAIICLFCLSGCKTKYIETERVVDHYKTRVDTVRDSISHYVSTNVYIKGDTVFKEQIFTTYKDRYHTRHDTVIVRDTLKVTQPAATKPATKLTWWESFRIGLFNWLAAAFGVGVLVWLLKFFFIHYRGNS